MIEEYLRKIGLSPNEGRIYLALLEHGPCLASYVAAKSRLNRTLAYAVLKSLVNKGLANSVFKEGRKQFDAASPEKLYSILNEREEEIRQEKNAVEKIIPDLKKLQAERAQETKVEVFEGREGYKTLMEDILNEGKDYFVIGYAGKGMEISSTYEAQFQRKRAKKKIWRNLLASPDLKGRKDLSYRFTRARFLPNEFATGAYTIVYGDKSIVFLPLKGEFIGVLIKSVEVAKSYRSSFNLLWKTARS